MPYEIRKNGNQYCIHNQDTGALVKGSCKPTREACIPQLRALYANVKASEGGVTTNNYLAFAESAVVGDDGLLWVEALPAKIWHDPRYGDVPVDETKLNNFVKNFNDNVRGQEIATDYEHGLDASKGLKASGTYRKFDIRPSSDGKTKSLWAGIEPTDTALTEIQNKEWKYFSLEWEDEWTHPETQVKYNDVIVGGALTNRPVAKGMMPINFSEVFIERKFATTKATTKPYGDVTYADPGYQADNKKRYPLDTEKHIRAAWSYINMPKNAKKYSSSQVASIKSKIKAAMKRIGANMQMSETQIEEQLTLNLMPEDEAVRIIDEMAPEEHSEPGTGIIDPSINEDDSADTGSRRDTPPAGEDGTVPDRSKTVTDPNPQDLGGENVLTEEQLKELLQTLGIDDNDPNKIIPTIKAMSEELEPLRKLREQTEAKKKFAEEYPEEAKRLALLEQRDQENFAKQFSESFADRRVTRKVSVEGSDEPKDEPTTLGFSALVLEKLQECAKQFSEGKPEFATFKETVDAIFENGIVDYGNKGSTRAKDEEPDPTVAAGSMDARRIFSEKVMEIMNADKLSFEDALVEAGKRHPKLAEAYRQPPVVASP